MALTTPPTTVAPFDEGYLSAGIGPTDTTIYVGPIYKTVNGVKTQQGFNSTAGLAVITQGDKTERVSFESISVDATTKVTTLSSCTRGLSVTSTSASYSAGTGCTFTKGARIQVVDDVAYNQAAAYTAKANTFTQAQTITAPVTVTGTSSYIAPPSMTTAQREALSGSPKIVYDTDLGQIYQNIGGAWAAVGDTGTPTASEAAEGKVELATVAEHVAATTGARVVQAKNCANNATDAAENKVVTLDSSSKIALSLMPTAALVPTGSMFQWLTDTAPTGYLLCFGQAVSRETYSSLFTVISTAFGSGDGTTTFNLPDLRGRLPLGQDDMGGTSADRVTHANADTLGGVEGAESVTLTTAQIPAHSHPQNATDSGYSNSSPMIIAGTAGSVNGAQVTINSNQNSKAQVSTSNTGDGGSHPNMPPYITVNYIIKT